jgi:UDP-glucose 4-epimerase
MSRYLIAGGAGFIGSHLADHLISEGNEVTILDDLSSGKTENINNKCNFIQGCITDQELVKTIFKDIDFCYHLAAIPSVQKSIDNWTECHKINLGGSINIFNEAAKHNVPVIYASSAAIYGNSKDTPIAEDSQINPESPYGLDKYCCELQAKLFGEIHGLKNMGLRFFNVYGPRQDPKSPYSGVISIFSNKINNNETIEVFGDGEQERDFIFVEDVISALIAAAKKVSTKSEVYNVCTGNSVTINELIQCFFTVLDKKVDIKYSSPREGDIYKSLGSPIKAKNELGFGNKIDLKTGLQQLLE